jgi:hypothetical protein
MIWAASIPRMTAQAVASVRRPCMARNRRFDVTVIGLDTVIAVALCPLAAPSFHAAICLELTNGHWITAQFVAREYLRRLVVRVRQCPL